MRTLRPPGLWPAVFVALAWATSTLSSAAMFDPMPSVSEAWQVIGIAQRSAALPSATDFSAPRETWQRLAQALQRGDRSAAQRQLTPAAQERYAATVDTWINAKPFDESRFGRVRAVTLSGPRFATVSLDRRRNGESYRSEAMMMRGDDGKWRVDRMPQD
ncbi:MAG: hypothetical protein M3Z31_03475 [Pseudomonadota bacterium]|nr:hypothetical protein [Pseudomonadota bacterium]